MARPKKARNFDEELMKVEAQITRHKNTIVELEETRKQIVREKQQSELSAVYQTISDSGMSIDQVISLIRQQSGEGESRAS
ncbi:MULTISPECIES: hypothetical protein [Eubacteriales]|uniref:Flagellar export protein FliJ n=1 Tax=Bittarella massiliensis (ex Durand et al. 2017) TaxID=1720313 RepID=A0AAQ1MCA0_9FIRM|nr:MULTISPECIES: hypothetical protein [Eubacteriales]MCB5941784.1 hypothetical protein [bacterium 210820-DFI.6.52]ERI99196.1 hypothetical protein HMPREF0262_02076 [Clostridium sp. ATCC 29733]MCQ4949939.1 hypothetical protein [Bittarella massiliensis (ex Durand et al. 2017)]MZL68498.1 hypothetical protein [Bittarella massiliensis (ex Durand et al. 2017)]MZL79447.1 hypothetical protein [Bittarella massiliensis (ex Durand et al. 2017)]